MDADIIIFLGLRVVELRGFEPATFAMRHPRGLDGGGASDGDGVFAQLRQYWSRCYRPNA